MLPRIQRLTTKMFPDKKGRVAHSSFFVVRVDCSFPHPHPRFGVVVSRKIDKRAVGRNKLKRRIYEAIQNLLPAVNKKCAVVVYVKQSAKNASFSEVQDDLKQLFEKTQLLSGDGA